MENSVLTSVYLDTNVLLDAILIREGTEKAKRIMQLGVEKSIRLCLSTLSTSNIAYITRKTVSPERLREVLKLYFRHFVILPNDDMNVYDCIHGRHPDFEDAMQISCATHGWCDAIVTNNKKHFEPYTDIPVFTPEEFLAKITE